MKDRIKRIRRDANMTQPEFGDQLGISRDSVASLEMGRVVPSKSLQMLICSKFDVNQRWLETGEGEPYKVGLIPELVHALRNAPALLASLENLVSTMTVEDWQVLNKVVQKAIDSAKPPDD